MFACRWRRAAAEQGTRPVEMEARLKSGIWIKALIRRCDLAAIPVAVLARGDDDAGAILLKFNGRDNGCSVLTQARGKDGELLWMRATGPVAGRRGRRRCLYRAPAPARPRPLGGRDRERVDGNRHRRADRVTMTRQPPPSHPDVEIRHTTDGFRAPSADRHVRVQAPPVFRRVERRAKLRRAAARPGGGDRALRSRARPRRAGRAVPSPGAARRQLAVAARGRRRTDRHRRDAGSRRRSARRARKPGSR